MDSANFLIYFFSDVLAKMKSWFYVIVLVHAISLCIIFSTKDNLQTAIKICLQNSRFKFPIINLGGFDCFWLLFIVRESIIIRTSYPGTYKKRYIEIYIFMLRIFLAFIMFGNKLHHLDPNKKLHYVIVYYYCSS